MISAQRTQFHVDRTFGWTFLSTVLAVALWAVREICQEYFIHRPRHSQAAHRLESRRPGARLWTAAAWAGAQLVVGARPVNTSTESHVNTIVDSDVNT